MNGAHVDLVAVLRVAMRRWLVTVPVLLIAIGVGVWLERSVDPVYEAAGSLLVTAQSTDDRPSPGDVIDLSEVAERVRLGDEARELAAASPSTAVTLEPTSATVVQIVVEGPDAAAVSAAADDLADLVVADVDGVQTDAGIEEDERLTASRTAEIVDPQVDEDDDGETIFISAVGVQLDDPFAARENPLAADLATARIIQVVGQSDRARQLVDAADPQVADYSLELEDFDQAPLVDISVLAPTEADALEGFDTVVAVVDELLDERQATAGVPSFDRVSVEPLAAPGSADNVSPPVSVGLVVVLALGVVLALVLAVLRENVVARRSTAATDAVRASDTPPTDTAGGNGARATSPSPGSTWHGSP
jgi:capsular polysaccharide biosynthesis protein